MKSFFILGALLLSTLAIGDSMVIRNPKNLACYLRQESTEFTVYYKSQLIRKHTFLELSRDILSNMVDDCAKAINVAVSEGAFIRLQNFSQNDRHRIHFEVIPPEMLRQNQE